jgi:PQQ-dependent catabolism-associated CXXCW motif protein
MRFLALAAFLLSLAAQAETKTGTRPPEPEGYRMEAFRAPVPATLKGATVVDTAKAFELWTSKSAVFVDALPRPPRPEGLPKNAVWREQPRFDIPGGVWLPDTGFGALSGATQRYFEKGLEKATAADRNKPVVFYCLRDCWMSWNAAKRALNLGYAKVYWYPEGTDGWAAATHPLEEKKPEPRE